MHLLVVEDDTELAEVLKQGLGEHGMRVSIAANFAIGRERMSLNSYDLIVLDEMLPGGSGTALCRQLRKEKKTTPVLMLTAKDTVEDRVGGLDAGADDYLTKPFAFRELLARIRALVRRQRAIEAETFVLDNLRVDLKARRLSRGKHNYPLTAKEFSLLSFFIYHCDEVVDRAAISAYVWDENHDPFTNVLEVLMRRLRRKVTTTPIRN